MRAKEFIKEDTVLKGPWKKPKKQASNQNSNEPSDSKNVVQGPWGKSDQEKYDIAAALQKQRTDSPSWEDQPSEIELISDNWLGNFTYFGLTKKDQSKSFKHIKRQTNLSNLPEISKLLGRKLKSYQAKDLFGSNNINKVRPGMETLERVSGTFIVWFPESNERYLVSNEDSYSYIPFWSHIVDEDPETFKSIVD